MLTILMYHYVRPRSAGRFGDLKAFDLALFEEQIAHLAATRIPVTMADIAGAVEAGDKLPDRATYLTFDDGYRDHRDHVLPVLLKHGMQGAFYPPVCSTLERTALDVNRIHFILATGVDPGSLVKDVENQARQSLNEDQIASLRDEFFRPTRWDDAATAYAKKLLQSALPDPLRGSIVAALFARHVSVDEAAFVDELYLTLDDLRDMEDAGMHIGGHGARHRRLSLLDDGALKDEIAATNGMLDRLRQPDGVRSFCYPYGAHSERVIDEVQRSGFQIGFSTNVGVADLKKCDPMLLPRLDPKDVKDSA